MDIQQFMTYERRMDEDRKAFNPLRKRYKLPSLDELQKEFLFCFSELAPEPQMMLSLLSGAIRERLSAAASGMEALMTVGSFSVACVAGTFSKKDMNRVYKMYKSLQELSWGWRIANLSGEKELAEWLRNCIRLWKAGLKDDFIWYNGKMLKGWKEYDIAPKKREDSY